MSDAAVTTSISLWYNICEMVYEIGDVRGGKWGMHPYPLLLEEYLKLQSMVALLLHPLENFDLNCRYSHLQKGMQ